MKIGLLSDTHSFLDPKVTHYFAACDEIWHAGDIGHISVWEQLRAFKPLKAVYGNIDDPEMQTRVPEDVWFECEGLQIWITHIAGAPPNYNPRIKKILKEKKPDILVAGHSHILKVIRDTERNFLFLNPGAAGNHGFHASKTLLRFEINNKVVEKMEVIDLGKRGALKI
jgi:uncharacterized protein